jgi:hypothetical protein
MEVPVWTRRGPGQYIPATFLLVQGTAFFPLPEPFPPPQGAVVAVPAKSKPPPPVFSAHFTDASSALPFWSPDLAAPLASAYLVAAGKAAALRAIAPNRRLVRRLSASICQQYRACLTSRPPVFTERCCKLVGDEFSIVFGRARLRQNLPDCMPSRSNIAAPRWNETGGNLVWSPSPPAYLHGSAVRALPACCRTAPVPDCLSPGWSR